jgi:hypothetical protein
MYKNKARTCHIQELAISQPMGVARRERPTSQMARRCDWPLDPTTQLALVMHVLPDFDRPANPGGLDNSCGIRLPAARKLGYGPRCDGVSEEMRQPVSERRAAARIRRATSGQDRGLTPHTLSGVPAQGAPACGRGERSMPYRRIVIGVQPLYGPHSHEGSGGRKRGSALRRRPDRIAYSAAVSALTKAAQYKQVTVLFADLVHRVVLAARLTAVVSPAVCDRGR